MKILIKASIIIILWYRLPFAADNVFDFEQYNWAMSAKEISNNMGTVRPCTISTGAKDKAGNRFSKAIGLSWPMAFIIAGKDIIKCTTDYTDKDGIIIGNGVLINKQFYFKNGRLTNIKMDLPTNGIIYAIEDRPNIYTTIFRALKKQYGPPIKSYQEPLSGNNLSEPVTYYEFWKLTNGILCLYTRTDPNQRRPIIDVLNITFAKQMREYKLLGGN